MTLVGVEMKATSRLINNNTLNIQGVVAGADTGMYSHVIYQLGHKAPCSYLARVGNNILKGDIDTSQPSPKITLSVEVHIFMAQLYLTSTYSHKIHLKTPSAFGTRLPELVNISQTNWINPRLCMYTYLEHFSILA